MKSRAILSVLAVAAICFSAAANANAADLRAVLSAREAYVGMPLTLQIEISNARDHDEPVLPDIDGVDVRSAGAPSSSSRISIINGRRSESRSIVYAYQITPRRAGTFEIPPISVKIDGRHEKTDALRFVATKSETGDLLFVEIAGKQDKIYVGQPLELTLKISVKPYRDREHGVTLSEADMWQLISNQQTQWGGFADRIKELAENNQRPGGEEVLRRDADGNERSFYLYEVDATVYPKRPGKIDANDVQIVVQYPTALGKARDPFASFFDDEDFPFPRSSFFDDDFSPFSRRLAVTSARPVVAAAEVAAIDVMPIPTAGRPADYRGAVGQYRMATSATPDSVKAGDPITLHISVAGTGPMDLVQAPPLATFADLTKDFKVSDEPLAGLVDGQKKLFTTTIRPRKAGITQIPAIPFSYFDPATESFVTVKSEPISIVVGKADALALGSIQSASAQESANEDEQSASSTPILKPDFKIFTSANVLQSESATSHMIPWLLAIIVPPLFFLAVLIFKRRSAISAALPNLSSADSQCLSRIKRADRPAEIISAICDLISSRVGKSGTPVGRAEAMGALRSAGHYELASSLEALFDNCERSAYAIGGESSLDSLRAKAIEEARKLSATRLGPQKKGKVKDTHGQSRGRFSKTSSASLVLLAVLFSANMASADQAAVPDPETLQKDMHPAVDLSAEQKQTLLQEANDAYQRAAAANGDDSATAKEDFAAAAQKYQTLVDAGVKNSELYFNLGNAYLRSGQLGRAIANYERARQLNPGNRAMANNLRFAESLVKQQEQNAAAGTSFAWKDLWPRISAFAQTLDQYLLPQSLKWLFCTAWIVFWSAVSLRVFWRGFRWQWIGIPLLIVILLVGPLVIYDLFQARSVPQAIAVTDSIILREGNGESFAEVAKFSDAQGRHFEILEQRGSWLKARAADGTTGWLSTDKIEPI